MTLGVVLGLVHTSGGKDVKISMELRSSPMLFLGCFGVCSVMTVPLWWFWSARPMSRLGI